MWSWVWCGLVWFGLEAAEIGGEIDKAGQNGEWEEEGGFRIGVWMGYKREAVDESESRGGTEGSWVIREWGRLR